MHLTAKQAERLARTVDAFPRVSVTVLGDMVADEFVYGEIARVSREAPVLILKHRERTVLPGGGANAVNNLAALGVNVLPVGVVGDDEPGRLLIKFFRQHRIPISGIQRWKGHSTVTKTRILAGMTHSQRQQVVRIDREPDDVPDFSTSRELLLAARNFAKASDALLISDYGYGAATPQIFAALRSRVKLDDVPVTLDSRYRMLQFSGVTSATPNEPEVEEALGTKIGTDDERLHQAGRTLLQRLRLESLVITRGRDGMALFERGKRPLLIPIAGSDQATDVTGAGDTVIAAYTAALAAGADAETAARLANIAGGVVVMKRGTATASPQELHDAIRRCIKP